MQSWGHRSLPGSPTPAGYVLSRVWVDEGSVCKDGGHGGTHRESLGTHLKNKARKPILHRQIWDGKPNFENPTVFTTEINRLYYPQNWWLSVAVIMWSSDQNLEVFSWEWEASRRPEFPALRYWPMKYFLFWRPCAMQLEHVDETHGDCVTDGVNTEMRTRQG